MCVCARVCVCMCVELFSLQVPNWKIVCYLCTLAKRGEKIKEATMSYNLKKATLYLCSSGVLLAMDSCNRNSFWIPLSQLKKEFNNGSILA